MNPLLAFILIASVSEVLSLRTVVVLSFDGFNDEDNTQENLPNLWQRRRESAAPKFMKTIFPPKTMVTLYTLSTGVYPNVHGVYANEMFNATGGVKAYKDNHFDDVAPGLIPIWIENQQNAGSSGIMMWPGGEFQYSTLTANKIKEYDETMNWTDRAETIVNWITEGKCNLVMASFEDYPCYKKADLDKHTTDHFKKIDNVIDYILKASLNQWDVVIMSDHGTSKVPGSNVIDIDSLVTDQTLQKIVSGPLVFIKIPLPDDREKFIRTLKQHGDYSVKFKAYQRETFQKDWYIKDAPGLNDVVVLVAELKYTFMEKKKFDELLNEQGITENEFETLENGYDNDTEDMNALFVGIGPGFKDDKFLDDFIDLIDVYQLLKALVGLNNNASNLQIKTKLSEKAKELLENAIVNAYK